MRFLRSSDQLWEYALWFLEKTGPVLFFGFAMALFLSRFVGLTAVSRSRLAIAFSLIFAFICLQPVYNHSYPAPPVGSAFGLAFAIVRLRCEQGRSTLGWLCAIVHGLVVVVYVGSVPRA